MGPKDKDLEWKNRVLCSDESCIGVIGPDGRCKECGLAFQGDLPKTIDPSSSEDTQPAVSTPAETPDADEFQPTDVDDEWSRRTLCIDESCIGVIGPDGRCKECGKPYKP